MTCYCQLTRIKNLSCELLLFVRPHICIRGAGLYIQFDQNNVFLAGINEDRFTILKVKKFDLIICF